MLSQKIRSVVTRKLLISIVLITNAFVWYYLIISLLKQAMGSLTLDPSTSILIWSLHFGGIGFSAIAGALLLKKIKNRTNFLIFWMILGTAASILSMWANLTSISTLAAVALFWGISLGIGMPCCMGYFTESLSVEKRGRIGGLILLLTGLSMVLFGMIGGDTAVQAVIISAWKLFGLVFLLIFKEANIPIKNLATSPSYRTGISQRSFLFYLVPWIMFSLITYLTTPIQDAIIGSSNVNFMILIENAIIAIFAVVGGFLLDIVGRKRMAILGFVLLGLGYAVLGIGALNMVSWYFYTVVDGVAWGILFVIFVVTIWGDLSNNAPSDLYYAIGVMPFFISKFLQFTIGDKIAASISATSIFSLTAIFLFIAVLPLIYAPETLPEKTMKDRELKSYLDKAQKIVQKETGKTEKQEKKSNKKKPQDNTKEKEENDEKNKEAKKLAEKYY
jgi:MFS family permease